MAYEAFEDHIGDFFSSLVGGESLGTGKELAPPANHLFLLCSLWSLSLCLHYEHNRGISLSFFPELRFFS